MRRLTAAMAVLAMSVSVLADEPPSVEQMQKMYDDAMAQLQDAQARKSELAKENETLNARIVEMQKELEAQQARVEAMRAEVVDLQQRTYQIRSQQAIWQAFLQRRPDLAARWRLLLEADLFDPNDWMAWLDGASAIRPATQESQP